MINPRPSIAAPLPVSAEHRSGFVISRRFDLAAFVAPPFLTVAFLLTQEVARHHQLAGLDSGLALSAVLWVVLAQSHFGATGLFLLDPTSRGHHRRHVIGFGYVPLALILGYTAIGFTSLASLALLAVPIASFWHGSRQSFGICGLYRGKSGSFDSTTRRIELVAIFLGGACFTSLGAVRLGMVTSIFPFTEPIPGALRMLWWSTFVVACATLVVGMWRAYRQSVRASVSPWPRLWVLFAGWAMYAPYLVAPDLLSAYLAALTPHYIQYHGLIYLVHQNKLRAGDLGHDSVAARIVASPRSYASATIGFGLALGAIVLAAHSLDRLQAGLCLVAGINVAHFWLDGLVWRFRDPHARSATLRYLRPPLTHTTQP